jgi:hypothetical protein
MQRLLIHLVRNLFHGSCNECPLAVNPLETAEIAICEVQSLDREFHIATKSPSFKHLLRPISD